MKVIAGILGLLVATVLIFATPVGWFVMLLVAFYGAAWLVGERR